MKCIFYLKFVPIIKITHGTRSTGTSNKEQLNVFYSSTQFPSEMIHLFQRSCNIWIYFIKYDKRLQNMHQSHIRNRHLKKISYSGPILSSQKNNNSHSRTDLENTKGGQKFQVSFMQYCHYFYGRLSQFVVRKNQNFFYSSYMVF